MSARRLILNVGDWYLGREYDFIETLLGSCVAVTFWHPQARLGGMCHYLLPRRPKEHSGQLADTRYGDETLQLMLKRIKALGFHWPDFEIGLYGGGRIFPAEPATESIGRQNTQFALDYFKQLKLGIARKDINGKGYRYIRLNVYKGTIDMLRDKKLLGSSHAAAKESEQ
ncbi:chemotaxis protein CheD [Chitinibacter sp. FCG-7]|uniref:Probable chemoreceptor glutamine deamidase CheD n=1 Tax=Chitinibacter mangrovi TaxID=3153927 RepID=A0AAU7FCZ4_9NEIS